MMNTDETNQGPELPLVERIAYLITGYLRNSLTVDEHDELDAWIVSSEENTRLFEELTDENTIAAGVFWNRQLEQERALHKIKVDLGLRKAKKPFIRTLWPYAITACLLLIALTLYLWSAKDITSSGNPLGLEKNDLNVRPGRDQAVLTLANGRTIILDSAGRGLVANEGGVNVKKGNAGEIIYEGRDSIMKYNLVSTPRGGQYKIILGDGTSVWLNAETSLRFPAGFMQGHREVELSGEAYFEVAKNVSSPFTVKIIAPTGERARVEVLGTHFNINSYGDEGLIKTTLVEGSVKMEKDGKTVLLRPGEQAAAGKEIKITTTDTEREIAWKNGLFLFHDADIRTIGAQVARWYDVDVAYKGRINYHFNATIDRKEPLNNLLKLLEGTNRVHFKLEGKKLLIAP